MNIIQLLNARETSHHQYGALLQSKHEESLISGNLRQSDFKLSATASSTISISVSCDGQTIATTHGDHTVKIFDFYTSQQIRVFVGHPRTPWTCKYHPSDPEIVASGCLGSEVRVWSIKLYCCVAMYKNALSIISLSFHPSGHYLAVACGQTIELWDWTRKMKQTAKKLVVTQIKYGKSKVKEITQQVEPVEISNQFIDFVWARNYCGNPVKSSLQDALDSSACHETSVGGQARRQSSAVEVDMDHILGAFMPHRRLDCYGIYHTRNIRAVLFHPSGKYMFVGAPDKPKEGTSVPPDCTTHCRLYVCPLELLFKPPTTPKVHHKRRSKKRQALPRGLLSDEVVGGVAPSSSGDEDEDSDSENSEDEKPTHLDPPHQECIDLQDFPTVLPQIHLYSDGGLDVSRDGEYLTVASRVYLTPETTQVMMRLERERHLRRKLREGSDVSPQSHPERLLNSISQEVNRVYSMKVGHNNEALRRSTADLNNFESASGYQTPVLQSAAAATSSTSAAVPQIGKISSFVSSTVSSEANSERNTPTAGLLTSSSTPPPPKPRGIQSLSALADALPPLPPNREQRGHSSSSYSSKPAMSISVVDCVHRHSGSTSLASNASGSAAKNTLKDLPRSVILTGARSVISEWENNLLDTLHAKEEDVQKKLAQHRLVHNMTELHPFSNASLRRNPEVHLSSTTINIDCGDSVGEYSPVLPCHRITRLFKLERSAKNVDWQAQDRLCLFRLKEHAYENEDINIISAELVNSTVLPGNLMKAVTSIKLSPTGQHILVGYGVRGATGEVDDHMHIKTVASEIYALTSQGIKSMMVMSDAEDEVNVAQFHSVPGLGVVYGTKRGKVKSFRKS